MTRKFFNGKLLLFVGVRIAKREFGIPSDLEPGCYDWTNTRRLLSIINKITLIKINIKYDSHIEECIYSLCKLGWDR